MQQLMAELHDFVTQDADRRDDEAKTRHKELLSAVNDSREAIVKAIEAGFRTLADVLRSR